MDELGDVLNKISNLNDQEFKIIAEASIVYLYDNDKLEKFNNLNKSLIQAENCRDVAKWLIKCVNICLRQNIEPNKIVKYLQSNFALEEKKSNIIKDLWEKHWSYLKDASINNQSLMISQLVDMEWKFGVTASTNKIDKLGNPFLQLKLVYNSGEKLETKSIELTLPQFYSFLYELNKAKSQMDYLS